MKLLCLTAIGLLLTSQFRVSVEAVQVDVYVSRKGIPLTGLTKENFQLFDNGVRQRIDLVRVESIPLNAALVLDASDSMAGVKLSQLKQASRTFVQALEDADRATVMSFSHLVRQHTSMTSDTEALNEAIDSIEARGPTIWRDALYAGLKVIETNAERSLLLLFTDGEDTYSWLRDDQLLTLVERSNALIYVVSQREASEKVSRNLSTIQYQKQWRRSRRDYAKRTRLLRDVTAASGGRLLETDRPQELEDSFLNVLSEIRTRYLLSYRPSGVSKEGWHELEVKLNNHPGEVQARRGYFYGTR